MAANDRIVPKEASTRAVSRSLTSSEVESGQWSNTSGGGRFWSLKLRTKNAVATRIRFRSFNIGAGHLWLWGTRAGEAFEAGPYSGQGPFSDGVFWSDPIPGDTVTLEFVPADSHQLSDNDIPFELEEMQAFYSFENLAAANYPGTWTDRVDRSCFKDAVCYPQSNVQKALDSSVYLIIPNVGSCSATMTSSRQNKPLLLTAGHCLEPGQERGLIMIPRYQTSSCNGQFADNPFTLPLVTGASLLAWNFKGVGDGSGDYAVLSPSTTVATPLYAGWATALPLAADLLISVSHPRNMPSSLMQASLRANSITQDKFQVQPLTAAAGRIDQGSSGSALHSPGNQIIGVLSYSVGDGSVPACQTPDHIVGYTQFGFIYSASKPVWEDLPQASPPIINSFTATPSSVVAGQAAQLKWDVTGADSVSINQDIGSVSASGSRPVSPVATTTYTLTALKANAAPVSSSVTVSIATAPIVPPSFPTEGVVSSAGFNPKLAPGSIFTIFGANLSVTTESATTVPLPLTLGGTNVTANGIAAPLFYVSPGQINAQMPVAGSGAAEIVVRTTAGSGRRTVSVVARAPGIFGTAENPIVQNQDFSLNSASAPAKANEIMVMWAGGLGLTSPAVNPGHASPAVASTPVSCEPRIIIQQQNRVTVVPVYVGLTAGAVGLWQLNFRVPTSAKTGSARVFIECSTDFSVGSTSEEVKLYFSNANPTEPLPEVHKFFANFGGSFPSPSTIINSNSLDIPYLNWDISNAVKTTINQGLGTVTPPYYGALPLRPPPASTTTYVLTAANAAGATVTASTTVTVAGPVSLTVSPVVSCDAGGATRVNVTWSVPERSAVLQFGTTFLKGPSSVGQITNVLVKDGDVLSLRLGDGIYIERTIFRAPPIACPAPKLIFVNPPSFVPSGDTLDVPYQAEGATEVLLLSFNGAILARTTKSLGVLSTPMRQTAAYSVVALNETRNATRTFTVQSGSRLCAPYIPPAYSGQPIRPMAFHNNGTTPVVVRTYWSLDPTHVANISTVPAGTNQYLPDNSFGFGNDYGIRVDDFCTASVGSSALTDSGIIWQAAGNSLQGLTTKGTGK